MQALYYSISVCDKHLIMHVFIVLGGSFYLLLLLISVFFAYVMLVVDY